MEPGWEPFIVSPEKDDWTRIQDQRERKRIQNRLAQRSHRMKYGRKDRKQQKNGTTDPRTSRVSLPPPAAGHGFDEYERVGVEKPSDELGSDFMTSIETQNHLINESRSSVGLDATHLLNSGQDLFQSYNGQDFAVATDTSHSVSTSHLHMPPPNTDTHFILLHSTSTIAAMLMNAKILSVPCDRPQGQRIFVSEHTITPPSLAPTLLQSTLPHFPYLDLLPIPAFRTNLLKSNEIIDVIEMWQDLSEGEIKVWGSTPWEEAGWEIGERFAFKWWYLMNTEVLRSTNFWRSSRGEMLLTYEGLKRSFRTGIESAGAKTY